MKEQDKAVPVLKDSEIKQQKNWIFVQELQIPYVQYSVLLRKEVYNFLTHTVGLIFW